MESPLAADGHLLMAQIRETEASTNGTSQGASQRTSNLFSFALMTFTLGSLRSGHL